LNGAERVVGLLGTLLARRERENAPARTARVLGRHVDGTELLQRTDAACVTRAPRDNHYAGTVTLAPALNAFHRSGSAGVATVSEVTSAETLWVERLEPSAFRPGQTYSVLVTGRGFDDRVWIDFLEPAPPYAAAQTINTGIQVLSLEVVDTENLLLEISLAPDARLYPSGAPIAYGRK
jgi:hypothetical protein